MNEIVEVTSEDDVTDDVLAKAVECAFASDMMGNRPGIDWEYAYNLLESTEGFFITSMDCPADRKIRREVARQVRAGRRE